MTQLKRILAIIMVFSVALYYYMAIVTEEVDAKTRTKNYIVVTRKTDKVKKIKNKYHVTKEINENSQNLAEENQIVAVEMTQEEAKALEKDSAVSFVEEDKNVKANAKKVYKKNEGDKEWNVRMIRADNVNKKNSNKKVKIAVIDSGIDWGNDIELKQSISLVPGEEEMTPLFMDGSGHGNAVAGLIAATDDGEGTTGINPDAEIYSIRVLDDDNVAPLSRVIEGIYIAIEEKVNIINMSFGLNTYSPALHEAIKDAADKGILIVAAAGNTGGNVEYPAAYDEVISVGSVDKNGEVASSSAKGSGVEIVAPGELVRSTGFLGDELVSSGTSLAAPQVAAVASLIWEKDLNMSADFVRKMLNESANVDVMGCENGLLDAEYALKNYDGFKAKYKKEKKTLILPPNQEDITVFEDTGCIKGSWGADEHSGWVKKHSTNADIQKGARFADKCEDTDKNGKPVYKKIAHNPWWHGGHTTNYIRAYIYATYLANYYGNKDLCPAVGFNYSCASDMKADIEAIKWNSDLALGTASPSASRKRAFIWGMAIHTLTDVFAHSTYIKRGGKWELLDHAEGKNGLADKTGTGEPRYDNAESACIRALNKYNSKNGINYVNGSYSEFDPVMGQSVYRLHSLRYYMDKVNSLKASSFAPYSYNDPVSSK